MTSNSSTNRINRLSPMPGLATREEYSATDPIRSSPRSSVPTLPITIVVRSPLLGWAIASLLEDKPELAVERVAGELTDVSFARNEGDRILLIRSCFPLDQIETLLNHRDALDSQDDSGSQGASGKTWLVLLSHRTGSGFLDRALKLGIDGLLSESDPPSQIAESLLQIAKGDCVISESFRKKIGMRSQAGGYRVADPVGLSELNPRQFQIFLELARGRTVKEISRILNLSEKSIDGHKYRLMRTLDMHDRIELAHYAIAEGLIDPKVPEKSGNRQTD